MTPNGRTNIHLKILQPFGRLWISAYAPPFGFKILRYLLKNTTIYNGVIVSGSQCIAKIFLKIQQANGRLWIWPKGLGLKINLV
jgi:hypothetical protein